MHRAQSLDREKCDKVRMEFVTLLSANNGDCAQDCAHCPQTAHYGTGTQAGYFLTTTDAVFYARKLLTIGNPDTRANDMPLRRLGMQRNAPQTH